MQYELGLPKFCISITKIVNTDNPKYIAAGVHTFLNPGTLDISILDIYYPAIINYL
jgi:hypothetical protein